MPTPPIPRLLLLEDDPVSARFLRDALAALPAAVEHATTLAGARTLAVPEQDLWIFDARLPDGHAADLLPSLRAQGLATPAIALSADGDGRTRCRLREAGFAATLTKPIAGDELRAAVRRHLAGAAPALPDWDDGAATAVLGSADAVPALRRLFLGELPEQCRRVRAACLAGDHGAASDVLHRLTSGCGYVGAAAMLAAVRELAKAPHDAHALARFEACAAALVDD